MELAPLARQRFFDEDGNPLANGRLYTYVAGSSTPVYTYSNRGGSQNTNPVILDLDGYADIWLTTGSYKFVLKDADDNLIWTRDDIAIPYAAALASAFWRDVVYITHSDSPYQLTQNQNGCLLSVDATAGAVVVNMPEIAAMSLPYNIGYKLTDASNTLTFNRAGTDTFEGATSKVANTTNQSGQFIADIDKSPDQWSVLDFGIVDLSGYPTVTPAAGDYVAIVDASDSSLNKKAPFKYFRNAVYRSVTTTDAVGTDDETMKLSGASFTSTLPTAVGVEGKRYKFIHAGTSLTQIYTLATTSAQTIGGVASGAFKLYTNGEVLEIESDGANWVIVGRVTATGITSGTANITATSAYVFTWTGNQNVVLGDTYSDGAGNVYTVSASTNTTTGTFSGYTGTPASTGTLTRVSGSGVSSVAWNSRTISGQPVIGTNTSNVFKWWRRANTLHFIIDIVQTNTGTVGVGLYLWPIPSGITIDTTYVITNGLSATDGHGTHLGNGTVSDSNTALGTNTNSAKVFAYNNKYLAIKWEGNAGVESVLGSVASQNFGDTDFVIYVQGQVPITEWQP